jgi:WD40 repeat protein
VSASIDGTVRVWGPNEKESKLILDCATFNHTEEAQNKRKDRDEIESVVSTKISNLWVQSGCETLWAACSDAAVRVWSGEGKPLRLLKGHDDSITAVEGIDPQDSLQSTCLVATGSADRSIRVWDLRAKKAQAFVFRGHTDTVLTLRWGECDDEGEGNGGKTLVSAGKDKTIKLWDMRAGRLRSTPTLEKHFGSVNSLRFVPSNSKDNKEKGGVFVSGGRDSMLHLWSTNGDWAVNFLSDLNFDLNLKISSKLNTFGVPLMLSSGADNIIKIWDMKRFKCVSEVQIGSVTGPLTKAVWAGQCIVAASGGNIRVWECVPDYEDDEKDRSGGGLTGSQVLKKCRKINVEWQSRSMASHAQMCTDLISTDTFVASSSKSGQIFRWLR